MNGTYSTPPSQTGSQIRGYVSPVISVSDLTQKIKRSLETSFPLLCIEGEVSNFKRQASGHLYFSLKDSQAQIAAVMFRSAASQLARLPAEGDQVTVKAQLTVYPARGSYQLIVQELTLSGSGQLLLQLEKLKENYRKLGYFDAERKKKLPEAPKRIGVVTSPTGAVIRDILNVLNRRHLGFHVILNPVKVQGEGAAEEIALAIDQMNAYGLCDVLIVARGGGSIEDLWAFNTEHVVEAIYRSEIPVISAVGHETDHTLADFVADVRAPTPSAAAEIVLEETASRSSRLDKCREQCIQALDRHLVFARRRLEWLLSHPLLSSGEAILRIPYQRLDELREELDRGMESRCERTAIALRHAGERLRALRPQNQIDHLKQ
ncbi:MAG: exodeoxyribonuclease VII large subunit, partial [Chlamydiia bacterium]|nr:exodeoxyribonuclease VII large subunit [Chlamydiia bacterium]